MVSDDCNVDIPYRSKRSEESTVAEETRKSWRELCSAVLEAKDPDELLEIVQELNNALKREEQVRRDFREARELSLREQSGVRS